MDERFHEVLKRKIHEFVTFCYDITKNFPKTEQYGVVSQFCRAAMSIMLNYVEGYGRRREKVKLNFYEIAHGSTQECKYILFFSFTQHWISEQEYQRGLALIEEIAKMIWSTVDQLESKILVS